MGAKVRQAAEKRAVPLIKALRGTPAYADQPLVMITADQEKSIRLDAIQAGAVEFLNKPIDPVELRRAKDHLKGSLMLGLESTSSRMSHLARQEMYRDRTDGLDEMLASIERVTAEDVLRLADRFFANGSLAVTVLGNVNGLQVNKEQLAL